MTITSIKRALISVANKQDLVPFAQDLSNNSISIISTGGTSQALAQAQVSHTAVEAITKLPEMLEGRVKTLHPKIHGAILAKRDRHHVEMQKHELEGIDLVVVNFYPFSEASENPKLSNKEIIEYIDIGGPTMVRAAAKNYEWVTVVVDPSDYATVVSEIKQHGGTTLETRQQLAKKAFALTSYYDALIYQYFAQSESDQFLAQITLPFKKAYDLRYGENPHQKAAAYRCNQRSGILDATQLQGKALSYNNILDADAAVCCVKEFTHPACVIVKHANPCGVAVAESIHAAYKRAYAADEKSAFGGIVALNHTCDANIAAEMTQIFFEIIIAPNYTKEALALFANKPNLRVLQYDFAVSSPLEMRFIAGGLLLQEKDSIQIPQEKLKVVTQCEPTPSQIEDLLFAWHAIKHVKSNAILIAQAGVTCGIGAGQVSRIDAVELALIKAGVKAKEAVLASDAFFPFRDSIDRIAGSGIKCIIQPGGSVRDEEVITACNEHGIAMVVTEQRCFKH